MNFQIASLLRKKCYIVKHKYFIINIFMRQIMTIKKQQYL